MNVLDGMKYSKDHEWVKAEGKQAFIGITDYAQHQLGDIVFVELPNVGADLAAGDAIGVVESVKSASDIFTPVSGKVVQVNETLPDSPEKLNKEPYAQWIAVLELHDAAELESLMSADEYSQFCGAEA